MSIKLFSLPAAFLCIVLGTGWNAVQYPPPPAATLHVLVFAQDDPGIGVEPDVQTLRRLCQTIQTDAGDLAVRFEAFDASALTLEKISAELGRRRIGPNDVVWCYYSGHGRNYDGWPKSAGTGMPLNHLNRLLLATGARLTITTYDCCNWNVPEVSADLEYFCNPAYSRLFLRSRGNIRMSSSRAGELSYGLKSGGGIFTNSLADNIGCYDTWQAVLDNTRDNTSKGAATFGMFQNPIYALSDDFMDGVYSSKR